MAACVHSNPLPGFRNKVFWGHNHAHLFVNCLWLIFFFFFAAVPTVELLQQGLYGPQSLAYLLSDSLRDNFADSYSRSVSLGK